MLVPVTFGLSGLALAAAFALLYFWGHRRSTRQLLLMNEAKERQAKLDVCLGNGTELVDLLSYLNDVMRDLPLATPQARSNSDYNCDAGGERSSSKFLCTLPELVMGEPQEAALGVAHLMQVSPAEVRAGMARGIREIQSEFHSLCVVVTEAAAAGIHPASTAPWWATREVAEEARECMQYCLDEEAGSSDLIFENSAFGRDRDAAGVRADRRLPSGAGMRLDDFCALPEAQTAKLELPHVLALRIYTTAAFKVLNGPLREPWADMPHPLPVTISFLSSAIGKLRAVGAQQLNAHNDLDLWRGMKDVNTSRIFEAQGGTELAPMSTTANLKVALGYASHAAERRMVLFKLRTDSFMSRGAQLKWISAFAEEDEVLFPPLTYLKPSEKPPLKLMCEDGRTVTVYEVFPRLGSEGV